MNEPGRLIAWGAILMFVAGSLVAFLRVRDWYFRRGWSPDPSKPAQDEEKWPQLKLDLRRMK